MALGTTLGTTIGMLGLIRKKASALEAQAVRTKKTTPNMASSKPMKIGRKTVSPTVKGSGIL